MWWYLFYIAAAYLITFVVLEADEKAREEELRGRLCASYQCGASASDRPGVPPTEAHAVEAALTRISQLVSNVPQQHERIVAEMQRAVDRRNAELMAERSRQLMECHKQLRAALVSQGDSPLKRQQTALVSCPQSPAPASPLQRPAGSEVVPAQKLRP